MKIIFLDIDGVLNSDVYMATDAYIQATKDAGCADPFGYDVVLKAHHLHIDPQAVALLNQLIEKSGAEVVLSSTWRLRYSLDEMNEMLTMRGATFKVLNQTPPPRRMSRTWRGEEIKEYLLDLKRAKKDVESFVILDDRDEFPTYKKNFVFTPERTGFIQEHLDRALKILNGEV